MQSSVGLASSEGKQNTKTKQLDGKGQAAGLSRNSVFSKQRMAKRGNYTC